MIKSSEYTLHFCCATRLRGSPAAPNHLQFFSVQLEHFKVLRVIRMICHPAPILCFLSDNEHKLDMCTRYWSMAENGTWAEKVTMLQEESGRSQRELLALIAASCRTYINGIRCHECGERPEVGTRQQFIAISKAFISNRHLHRCNACAQAAQARQMADVAAEEGRKKVQLSELLAPIEARMSLVDYGALEYTEAFFLYSALLAAGECWQGRHIMSVRVQPQNLAPTAEMATAIYMRLYDEGIIALSSCSSPKAFNVVDEAAGKFTFSPLEVAWTLALPKNDMPIEGILASLEKVLAQRDPATITQLWSMVAEAECERYFGELCTRYRFSKEVVFEIAP